MSDHTPLPWLYVLCDAGGEDIQDAPYISIQEDTKVPIISTAQIGPPIDETDVANAKLIVTSVNAHERLEADSKKLREPATCNAGHKSNLPIALWDCPVCTQLLRDKLQKVEELLRTSRELASMVRTSKLELPGDYLVNDALKQVSDAIREVEAALGGKAE